MDVNQQAEFEVLCQAQSFLDVKAGALRALNRTPARAELDDLLRSIRAEAAEQQRAGAAAESQTAQKNRVHARLRHELGRIRALAVARKEHMPDLQVFKPLSRNTSDLTLETYAMGMADIANQYRDVFEREGFGEDFVGGLRALIAEFHLVCALRTSSQQRRFLAARTIEVNLRKAWKTISLLEALFEPDNAEHRRLQADWKVETLHAPRALPKPQEVPKLTAGEGAPVLALSSGDPATPGTAIVTVAEQPVLPAPSERRGLLRLIGRLFGSERAA